MAVDIFILVILRLFLRVSPSNLKQPPHLHPQRLCQLTNRDKRRPVRPRLNVPNRPVTHPHQLGQRFLRQASGFPQVPDPTTKLR